MQKIHFLKLILISLVITLTANANDAYKHDELDTKSRDFICNIDNLPSLVQYYGSRIQKVGVLYLSWKRCGVNFDKALSYNMQLSLLQKLPMYDFSVVSIGDINQRYFIHKHNGDYAKEIFDLEYNISTYLKKYSSGLGLLRSDYKIYIVKIITR